MPSNDAHNAWKKGQPLDKAVTQHNNNNNNNNMGKTQKERHIKKNQIKILEIARPTWTVV
jgi:hypothetical protein